MTTKDTGVEVSAADILAKQMERAKVCGGCKIGFSACQFLSAKQDSTGIVETLSQEAALAVVSEKCADDLAYLEEHHPDFANVECPLGFWGAMEEIDA